MHNLHIIFPKLHLDSSVPVAGCMLLPINQRRSFIIVESGVAIELMISEHHEPFRRLGLFISSKTFRSYP